MQNQAYSTRKLDRSIKSIWLLREWEHLEFLTGDVANFEFQIGYFNNILFGGVISSYTYWT